MISPLFSETNTRPRAAAKPLNTGGESTSYSPRVLPSSVDTKRRRPPRRASKAASGSAGSTMSGGPAITSRSGVAAMAVTRIGTRCVHIGSPFDETSTDVGVSFNGKPKATAFCDLSRGDGADVFGGCWKPAPRLVQPPPSARAPANSTADPASGPGCPTISCGRQRSRKLHCGAR